MKKFEKIVNSYNRLYKFITHDIWVLDFTELSRVKARFMRYLQITILTIKGISTDKIGIQASSLSFFSALSAIPIMAMLFAVTGGFGMRKWLEDVLYATFSGSSENVEMIVSLAYNIIDISRNGMYGFITLIVLLWTIIILMQNIERCFNEIWKVEKSRFFVKRLIYYIGILILSPFLIFVFLWVSVMFTSSLDTILPDIRILEGVKDFVLWIIAGAIIAAIFTALFKYIPNKKVHFSAAINAAAITALVFTVTQYLYFETQLLVTRMNHVYGVFAAIPLFLIWINTSWWIILLGAELSYAFQDVDNYKLENNTKTTI